MPSKSKPIAIDLFCGVGGMSLGFEQAGFDVVAAMDFDTIHTATYAKNFPQSKTLTGDLADISGKELRQLAGLNNAKNIDIVFGGPPCQGFSTGGRKDPNDPRNHLLLQFARLVSELRPTYFVMENVRSLLNPKFDHILKQFQETLGEHYCVLKPSILNASDFGIPQRRRRVFFIGYLNTISDSDTGIKLPIPLENKPTVWDAIGDLPNIDNYPELANNEVYSKKLKLAHSEYAKILRGELVDDTDLSLRREKSSNGLTGCQRTLHSKEVIERFTQTLPGSSEPVSRFYRLAKDGVAPTLRAGSGRSEGSYTAPRPIHPIYPRCITIREAARLHSFPDWFTFHSTKWHGYRQIGNSVPPLLARAVAHSFKHLAR